MAREYTTIPVIENSGAVVADTGAANNVTLVPIPGTTEETRPNSFQVFFIDAGQMVMGRCGLAGVGTLASHNLAAGANATNLGYVAPNSEDQYSLRTWTKYVAVASPVANAECYITWFYNK